MAASKVLGERALKKQGDDGNECWDVLAKSYACEMGCLDVYEAMNGRCFAIVSV